MSDPKANLFAIPGIVPALVAEVVGLFACVVLMLTGQPMLGALAIIAGGAPMAFVLVRHSAGRKRGGRP